MELFPSESIYYNAMTFIDYVERSNSTITLSISDGNIAKVKILQRVVYHHMQPERGLFGWRVQILESSIPHVDVGMNNNHSLYWWCILQYPKHDIRNTTIPVVVDHVSLSGINPNGLPGLPHSIYVEATVGLPAPPKLKTLYKMRVERFRWRSVLEKVYIGLRKHRDRTGQNGNIGIGGWHNDVYGLTDEELLHLVETDPYVINLED